MILKSFLLGNLVSLYMKIIYIKIINSAIVVGLYYGFMTTFSIGPTYIFLLQAQVMEEGTQKKVSATAGFIMGQLIMFISIYYAPMHLALDRPHTITVLALPYILFHFFWNNHKHFFDYGSTTRNSTRNLIIQCVFLKNLIFQLFNHFILPSSMLYRLVNIYMFRCNNKILFVTSSFVGWLIGHILFMKWLRLVLVWIRQNHYIRLNIRSNKYLISEFINSMVRIFSILLFITCVYYLGRIPSPIFTKKLKETKKMEQGVESEEERDVEIETASGTKHEQEGFKKEYPSPSPFSEKRADKKKIHEHETEEIQMNVKENNNNSKFKIFEKKTENNDFFFKEKPLMNLLFDSKRWNQPFRYIKNELIEGTVRNEMSQYFFQICKSDGKKRMSFTYLPGLSIFLKMIKRRISPPMLEKSSSNKLSNPWLYTNKQKGKSFNNEFINRIEALDKEFFFFNILETKTRLCNDDYTKEYLSKRYDPLLNRSYRKTIYKNFPTPILKKTLIENFIEIFLINRIHGILISDTDCQEFEQKINRFDKKPFSSEIFDLLISISRVIRESRSTDLNDLNCKVLSLFSKRRIGTKFLKYLLTQIVTDVNDQKIIRNSTRIKEISKKVLRWSYKLITELEQQSGESYEDVSTDHQIRSRKSRGVAIFTDNKDNTYSNTDTNDANTDTNDANTDTNDETDTDEVALIHYSQQSDFRRGIITGSIRSRRRKIVILELFQANVHSPLFLDRIKKKPLLFFDISGLIKLICRGWAGKGEVFKILEYTEEKPKIEEKKEKSKRRESARIEIAEAWDTIPLAQVIRGCMLLTQSIFRKHILLPSFIIAKNIGRILLFQLPEWSEDFQERDREVHIKCTYNGVPLSETEFPKNWLTDGIQIKILFPFCLKPWNKLKLGSSQKDLMENKKQKDDFCFLTVWGMEAELPFGSPRKQLSFFKPIFMELKKKYFRVLIVLKGKTKLFIKYSKETKKWFIKITLLITKKIKELYKVNQNLFFRLREVKIYESKKLKKEKNYLKSNQIIHESLSKISSPNWINSSFTEKKMTELADRTSTIFNQIEIISKEKKKVTPRRINNIISANKTNYDAKRFKKWQILKLKRRNAQIICKLPFFIKFLIERIYTYIFFSSINISKINTEFFIKLIKKNIYKSIYNNERKQEIINKKKKNSTLFISKSLYNINSKNNLHTLYNLVDLSYMSQAYVFFKLSQIKVNNSDKLRSVLHYQGIPPFLKPEVKDFFETRGMTHFKLGYTKLPSYEMNQWKNWLSRHYQYILSEIKWSRLIPEKWRNVIHKFHIYKRGILKRGHSYGKDQLIYSKKQKEFEVYSFSNKKDNFKKDYRYDLLSYKFLNYENKVECLFYGSSFQGNNNKGIHCTSKGTPLGMLKNISINNYLNNNLGLGRVDTLTLYFDMDNIDMIKMAGRKYFYWMRMNGKMLKHPISNAESWFFPEYVLLYNAYKIKPWVIQSKLLIFNLNIKNRSENKKIDEKEKVKLFIASKKKYIKKKESTSRGDLGSVLSQQKDIEEIYVKSNLKKGKNKKQYKNKTEAALDLFLKRYLLFQLRWGDTLNQKMINNIKIYCLLLRLIDPRKIAISSIYKREMNLDIMLIQKNLSLTELMKRGMLIIEPVRMPVKKNGQLIMYQTIIISLIYKSKHQTNKKYREQRYVSKNHFDETISTHPKITKNSDKNSFDLLVPENILLFRRRRKLRILNCFNSKTRNSAFWNENNIKNKTKVLHGNKHLESNLDRDKNQLMKLKLFIWPNYRLEDLACMNRYWFDANNGSRFSLLRVHPYPRLKK